MDKTRQELEAIREALAERQWDWIWRGLIGLSWGIALALVVIYALEGWTR